MTTTHLPHVRPDETAAPLRPLMLLTRAGAIGFILIVGVLHIISSELDPVSRLVSEYVLGDFSWLMRLAFFSVTLALLAMTLLAYRALPASPRRNVVTGLLCVTTLGTAVVGVFDTDPKDVLAVAPTTSGLIHYWAFMTSVLAFLAAMVVLWRLFSRTPRWQEYARPQLLFAAALPATFLLMFFSSTEVVGLTQRVYLLAALAWLLVASGWLAHLHEPAPHRDEADTAVASTSAAAPDQR